MFDPPSLWDFVAATSGSQPNPGKKMRRRLSGKAGQGQCLLGQEYWSLRRSRRTQGYKPNAGGPGGTPHGNRKQAIFRTMIAPDRELYLLAGCLDRVGLHMALKADLKPRGMPEVKIRWGQGDARDHIRREDQGLRTGRHAQRKPIGGEEAKGWSET